MTLTTSSGPFTHKANSVQKVMTTVLLALLPATAFDIYLFGWPALFLFITTIASCVAIEAACVALTDQPAQVSLSDNSAVLTGWLMASSLPYSWTLTTTACLTCGQRPGT